MTKKHNPKSIAPPAGKYTHAIESPADARWLHISGQIGAGPDGTVPTGIEAQAENCWKNIRAILAEANMSFDDIVKVSIFLTKSEFIVPLRAVRERFIGDLRPASTLVVVSALAQPEYLCEIEAVAAKVG